MFRLQMLAGLTVLSVGLSSSNVNASDSFVEVAGRIYSERTEFECVVEKAVPAPERGSTWYTSSPIGDVRMKAEPTNVAGIESGKPSTGGVIRFYRLGATYQELVVYQNAFWMSDGENILGNGDANGKVADQVEETPLYFSVSTLEAQGLFHGSDGRPAYFLSRCRFSPSLVELSAPQQAWVRTRATEP